MRDEDIRKLICSFVEEGELSEEVAKRLLQKILHLLFDEKTGADDG